MSRYDVIIVGAGIVGLGTAHRLLEARPSTRLLILEKESTVASHQSGRNSGVIHSGIYYKPGGLKAQNCRTGYLQLLDFCRTYGIAHDICGKIIVATRPDELPRLEELHRRGVANGLMNLQWLDPVQMREIEPNVAGIRGLRVTETGIVDYPGMSLKLAELIQQRGGQIRLGEPVINLIRSSHGCEVTTPQGTYAARTIVTCGGLQSDRLARQTHPQLPMRIVPFRGEYFKLVPERHYLVKNLIYPVPDPAFPFLGVHFTRMVHGGVEAGPNAVLAFGREAYRKTDFNLAETYETLAWPGFRKVATKYWRTGFGEFRRSWSKAAFVRALQRLLPAIQSEDLVTGGAGIRAQACLRDGSLVDDFYILEDRDVIHVCNAPSPAATACLSIGSHIGGMVLPHLN